MPISGDQFFFMERTTNKTGIVNKRMVTSVEKECIMLLGYGVHNIPDGRQLIRISAYVFLYLLGNAEKHGYKGKEAEPRYE